MINESGYKYWQKVSVIYDFVIKKNVKAYKIMLSLICERLDKSMRVLELATGTGQIAIAVSPFAGIVEAIDFSPKMIARAQKKKRPENVTFSVRDACKLPYEDRRFDVVIISNTLHIMPQPERALREIRRVLKDGGLLIAPTFVHKSGGLTAIKSTLMTKLTGFPASKKWSAGTYCDFLKANGWSIRKRIILKSSFPICYTECTK
ncbi:MAG: class I SAM-dependent methyltransferase [Oscillospiraceae bacterium]|jgi:ubiquinone/menaquinone biosynthesis C-methylase UbiE